MCVITATELKQNLGLYLDLAQKEDVYVKKNGKTIVKLSSVGMRQSSIDAFLALDGKYEGVDYETILSERDSKR